MLVQAYDISSELCGAAASRCGHLRIIRMMYDHRNDDNYYKVPSSIPMRYVLRYVDI